MSETPHTHDGQCEAAGCTETAKFKLEYDEEGTPITHKWCCETHKNRETIHAPGVVEVVEDTRDPLSDRIKAAL